MATYYKAKYTFECEDLLNDNDEHVPEYTAHFDGVEYFKGDRIEVELMEIVGENGEVIPTNKFSKETINYLYDKAYYLDFNKVELE